MRYPEIMESFRHYVVKERPKLQSPQDAADLMRPLLVGKLQEEMHVLCLSSRKILLTPDTMAMVGLVDRCNLHPREIFRRAIVSCAASILLVHNHPSGDTSPSLQDISSTKQLVEAGKVLGIEVVDHIIIGDGYTSMLQEGLLCD